MTTTAYLERIKKRTIISLFYLSLLVILLSFSYVDFVVPEYGYMGFYTDVSPIRLLESILLLFLSYIAVHGQQNTVSGQFLGFIYLFTILPLICFYMLTSEPRLYLYVLLIGFLLTLYSSRLLRVFVQDQIKVLRRSYSYITFDAILTIVSSHGVILLGTFLMVPVIIFGTLARYNGIPSLTALSLTQVYEVRSSVIYGPTIIEYLINWQSNVLSPALVSYGMYKNKAMPVITGVAIQFFLFLYTGHKTMLFSIPLVILVYILVSNKSLFIGLLKTFNVVILGSLSALWIFNEGLIPSLFIRRVFFLPSLIRNAYFDYFSSHAFAKMGETSLGFLWTAPYSDNVPSIIGQQYFQGAYANTGYLASAYADFGVVGVIVFAAIAGAVFFLIDWSSGSLDQGLVAGIWIVPVFSLLSSRLSTTLLSHGILISLVITVLLRENQRHEDSNSDRKKQY